MGKLEDKLYGHTVKGLKVLSLLRDALIPDPMLFASESVPKLLYAWGIYTTYIFMWLEINGVMLSGVIFGEGISAIPGLVLIIAIPGLISEYYENKQEVEVTE